MPAVHWLKEALGVVRAHGQALHKNMVSMMQAEEFEIEDNYAQVLMVIVVGFMFGGGIPAMIPVCLVGLATRYIYCKIAFIRFSRVPKAFAEALNDRALRILKVTLIIRGIISIYMYGVDDIFLVESSTIADWVILVFIIGQRL